MIMITMTIIIVMNADDGIAVMLMVNITRKKDKFT